jgi:hypothetical protein
MPDGSASFSESPAFWICDLVMEFAVEELAVTVQ